MSDETKNPQFTRRTTVRLGRRFAGTLAKRLDEHPATPNGSRLEAERRILELAREVLVQPEPDPHAIAFLSQAVEAHTQKFGYSESIYGELLRLHESRVKRVSAATQARAPKKNDLSLAPRILKA